MYALAAFSTIRIIVTARMTFTSLPTDAPLSTVLSIAGTITSCVTLSRPAMISSNKLNHNILGRCFLAKDIMYKTLHIFSTHFLGSIITATVHDKKGQVDYNRKSHVRTLADMARCYDLPYTIFFNVSSLRQYISARIRKGIPFAYAAFIA